DRQSKFPLGLYLEIFQNPTNQLTIEQVASPQYSAYFVASTSETPNFGLTTATVWARFRVRNESQRTSEWMLELALPQMSEMDLYLSDGTSYVVKRAGSLLPFAEREEQSDNLVFRLPLPSSVEQTIYMRYRTDAEMLLPLTLWSPQAFEQHNQRV